MDYFWSVSCSFSLQDWSRSMPCPSRGTMSYVSTWRILKITQHTLSMVPLEWASSQWTLMMMDTRWPSAAIPAMQVLDVHFLRPFQQRKNTVFPLIKTHYFHFLCLFLSHRPDPARLSTGLNNSLIFLQFRMCVHLLDRAVSCTEKEAAIVSLLPDDQIIASYLSSWLNYC